MNTLHKYLFIVITVLVVTILFSCTMTERFTKCKSVQYWVDVFRNIGISESDIGKISHDNEYWYYLNKNTCVGYSENDTCDNSRKVCSKGLLGGGPYSQALLLKEAINNNAYHVHRECPLLIP